MLHGAAACLRDLAVRAARSVARAGGLDEATVGILPLPVDLERFTPAPDDEWRATLDDPVLVFVGRADDPRKNAGLLLDALPSARTRGCSSSASPPAAHAPARAEATGVVPTSPRTSAAGRSSSSRPTRRASGSRPPRRWRPGSRS